MKWICDLREADRPLAVKEIANWLQDRHGEEYERKITTKWVGNILRKKLHLATQRTKAGYIVPPEEFGKFPRLYGRYGLELGSEDTAATS